MMMMMMMMRMCLMGEYLNFNKNCNFGFLFT
jgi:hypothetical protein